MSPSSPDLRLIATSVALLVAAGCAATGPLHRAQVSPAALQNARTRLRQGGGDPAKILRPVTGADLLALQSGKPHKMVVVEEGKLAIAPAADAPGNLWSHVVLADGAPVRTAGHIVVEHAAREITRVTLDQESHAYCPTLESLRAAGVALRRLGVPAGRIQIRNHPPGCSPVTR